MSETTGNLNIILPQLLPKANNWAKKMATDILSRGRSLNDAEVQLAKAVGVLNAKLVRVSIVPSIPLPEDPELKSVADQIEMFGTNTLGLTLGYGIYICKGHLTSRLLSHECRHVYQYEVAGSISNFISDYFKQIVKYGYHNAPFEVDARNHEIDGALARNLKS